MKKRFGRFYLDKEKDIIVDLFMDGDELFYTLRTPNHGTGNLIRNLAKLCDLPLSKDENDLLVINGRVPSYYDTYNRLVYVSRRNDRDEGCDSFDCQDIDVADQELHEK